MLKNRLLLPFKPSNICLIPNKPYPCTFQIQVLMKPSVYSFTFVADLTPALLTLSNYKALHLSLILYPYVVFLFCQNKGQQFNPYVDLFSGFRFFIYSSNILNARVNRCIVLIFVRGQKRCRLLLIT